MKATNKLQREEGIVSDRTTEAIAAWLDYEFGFKSKQASKTKAAKLIEYLEGQDIYLHNNGQKVPGE